MNPWTGIHSSSMLILYYYHLCGLHNECEPSFKRIVILKNAGLTEFFKHFKKFKFEASGNFLPANFTVSILKIACKSIC